MSVYVDRLRHYPRTASWRFGRACHLMADSLDELHAFAARIGLRREWFQDHATLAHYDLTATRRAAAIRAGAVEESTRNMIKRVYAQRGTA